MNPRSTRGTRGATGAGGALRTATAGGGVGTGATRAGGGVAGATRAAGAAWAWGVGVGAGRTGTGAGAAGRCQVTPAGGEGRAGATGLAGGVAGTSNSTFGTSCQGSGGATVCAIRLAGASPAAAKDRIASFVILASPACAKPPPRARKEQSTLF